jgi:hypothetical protein
MCNTGYTKGIDGICVIGREAAQQALADAQDKYRNTNTSGEGSDGKDVLRANAAAIIYAEIDVTISDPNSSAAEISAAVAKRDAINNFLEMGCRICEKEYPEGSQEYWRCRTRNSDKGCYDDNTLYSST